MFPTHRKSNRIKTVETVPDVHCTDLPSQTPVLPFLHRLVPRLYCVVHVPSSGKNSRFHKEALQFFLHAPADAQSFVYSDSAVSADPYSWLRIRLKILCLSTLRLFEQRCRDKSTVCINDLYHFQNISFFNERIFPQVIYNLFLIRIFG